jgi:Sulfotransferase family
MSRQAIPNFFIAGAPKGGTTSLYHHLSQHPDIFMSPVKEPCYFAHEIRPGNYVPELRARMQQQMETLRARLDEGLNGHSADGIVAREEDYLKLFDGVRGESAVGEASVSYLWSKTAAQQIAAFNPGAKIVLVLRHPAERAFSHYLYILADGHIAHTCSEQIAASLKSDGAIGLAHPFLDFGFYGQQIERLLDHIPQRQVRVWLYEDTLVDPPKFFREVLTFLGVDAGFVPDTSHRHLQREVPKVAGVTQALRRHAIWSAMRNCTPAAVRPAMKKLIYRRPGSVAMSAEDRRFLVQYYRDDVRRLERVIERDLSAWLH